MRRLNSIDFVEDEKSAIRVGAGNVWADVYRELDPWGMSATGTRNSLTGVVGSILGGE
jgi:FAD/FMN-containing dehydrogenase